MEMVAGEAQGFRGPSSKAVQKRRHVRNWLQVTVEPTVRNMQELLNELYTQNN